MPLAKAHETRSYLSATKEGGLVRSIEILREMLGEGFSFLHAKRQSAIWRGVEAVARGGRLWLTALGRDMSGPAKEKHRIKAADRLLGNRAIHAELNRIYSAIACWLMRGMTRPVILVDWTGCGPDRYLLRAGLPIGGRSILLHARVVSKRKLSNHDVHDDFLDDLARIVPKYCRPIIVTDAGFYYRWIDKVSSLNWDFVARLRGHLYIKTGDREESISETFQRAGKYAKDLGECLVGTNHQRTRRLVLASKRKSKGRTRLNQKGLPRRTTDALQCAKAAREPWLLATSLTCSAAKVVATYARRMQIEEAFRDLKSPRFGWAFEYVTSKNPSRTEVLLMIATLASLAILAVGAAAESQRLEVQFQANTTRKRRVLSWTFLGRRIIETAIAISDAAIRRGLAALRAALRASSPMPLAPI
jgi:hypothetical protein